MLARLWHISPSILHTLIIATVALAWKQVPSVVAPIRVNPFGTTALLSSTTSTKTLTMNTTLQDRVNALQDVIGADTGGRGMKRLIVPGDLYHASRLLGASLPAGSTVVILSGFPCCVQQSPPTETDGPPGTMAIARAAAALGHKAVVVVDECNAAVFRASLDKLALPLDDDVSPIELQSFPSKLNDKDQERFQHLMNVCDLWIACERAGPANDGVCYTMRGIDMNAAGLIAPLHRLVTENKNAPFVAIGDGGNELGMGKVIDIINAHIPNGDRIGCVVPADHLIAASVSNWGGYALAAGAALCKVEQIMKDKETGNNSNNNKSMEDLVADWIAKCLPTAQEETELLQRAVNAGCRDGVSGKMEATVDGMPLETSLQCLANICATALGKSTST